MIDLPKLLTLVALVWNSPCHAEEVRLACAFSRPEFVPEMDAEATELRRGFQASNLERVVLLEMTPPAKVLNRDSLFRLFPDGPAKVMVDKEKVLVIWAADDHPRRPAMNLTVNRFSLEAVEYFQIKKLGPAYDNFSWTRSGKCKLDGRKF